MSEHLVCLSFDFDAMSGYVSRGMVTPTPISRGEFGAVGVERLLALLDDRNIQASWFIPGVVIGTYPSLCRQIAEAGHEIGHHGWTHDTPASMSREHEADALARGNEAIVGIAGQPARGYRSPAWDLSPHTIELLLEFNSIEFNTKANSDVFQQRMHFSDRRKGFVIENGQQTPHITRAINEWKANERFNAQFLQQVICGE